MKTPTELGGNELSGKSIEILSHQLSNTDAISNPSLKGLLLDSSTFAFSSNGDFETYRKVLNSYDKLGRIKNRIDINFQGDVINKRLNEYFINADTTVYERQTQIFNHYSQQWQYNSRVVIFKSNDSKESTFYSYKEKWDEGLEKQNWFWGKRHKYIENYNRNGDIIRNQFYEWIESETTSHYQGYWELKNEWVYTYNSDGKIQTYSSNFNRDGIMFPDQLTEYIYEADREIVIQSEYHHEIDYWQAVDMYEYQYDEHGNLIETVFSMNEKWLNGEILRGPDSLDWLPQYKYENIYNEKNELAERRNYLFLDYFWFNNSFIKYLTDEEGIAYYIIYSKSYGDREFEESATVKNKSESNFNEITNELTRTDYNWENDKWVPTQQSTEYYSSHSSAPIFNEAVIYPNPSSDFISLDLGDTNSFVSLSLYDFKGNEIISYYVSAKSKIDIRSISKGMYFYRAVYNDEISMGRFIKN